MTLCIVHHPFHFEIENVCRIFLPQEKIITTEQIEPGTTGVIAVTALSEGTTAATITCRLMLNDFDETLTCQVEHDHPAYRDECERRMAELVYHLFVKLLGVTQQWGIVTGVRPVKLLRRLIAQRGEDAGFQWMQEKMLVSPEKMALARTTLHHENKILSLSRPDSFSLYVSVPFCPTRCDYCSFVSQTVTKAYQLIPDYVQHLTEEIAYTAALAKELGLRLETVYFGGGTPTTLTAEQLKTVTDAVRSSFDLSHLREYTVEAGRPDTVTMEKLRVLKEAGVDRISINPQTLHDSVLENIGRKHTVQQFYDAFDMARRAGHDNINTDLIAGLPGDSYEGFCGTIDGILALDPESVTVHTLSMKRASNLVIQKRADYQGREDAAQMIAYAAKHLPNAGYHPYYLYRQSRMVGNQENVGWAKEGKDGLYNVYIMDETHTILACGAGAVSKLKQPGTDFLERIFNYKFPYEYNDGFEEMLRRKNYVKEFYKKYVFSV